MFNGMLGSSKNPNQNRYIRLIALSAAQVFCSLPVSLFAIYFNLHDLTVFPWISWENTHFHYSFVGQIPSVEWRADSTAQLMLEISRWNIVFSAFIFFAFFGFAEEARKHYRIAYSFASSSLRLPDFGRSRANSSPRSTPYSSFGQGFKKGVVSLVSFKDGLSTLGSRGKSETMTERKGSLVSDCRLTSSDSIFEDMDDPPKAFEFLPVEDDFQLAPDSRGATQVFPVVLSVPSPPITSVVHFIPPGRLDSPLPHRPTSSDLYLDPSEKV